MWITVRDRGGDSRPEKTSKTRGDYKGSKKLCKGPPSVLSLPCAWQSKPGPRLHHRPGRVKTKAWRSSHKLWIYVKDMKALSIRQPWAWLIVNGYKDIENRDWSTKLRGRIWIHTGAHQVTKEEYEQFVEKCRRHQIRNYPEREAFQTGGIVATVEIVDCVTKSTSPWFEGKYGFVIKNPRTTRFNPNAWKT